MGFFKRMSLYIIICFCVVGIYKDLQKDVPNYDQMYSLQTQSNKTAYQVVKVKLKQEDTFLSVVEKIHEEHLEEMNINQMMNDFKSLNPDVNPYYLEPNTLDRKST